MGIAAAPASFRFTHEELGMIDQIRIRFSWLFASRKAVLVFAIRALWDAVFMTGSVRRDLELLKSVLCTTVNDEQLSLNFPPHTDGSRLRVRFGQWRAA